MNNATLPNTSHIHIFPQGRLDVTATTGGTYALVGRKVTVDGQIVGNIRASNRDVALNATNSVQGNVTVNAAVVHGTGGISGNLTAEAGGIIRVGTAGFAVVTTSTPVTYTDATG